MKETLKVTEAEYLAGYRVRVHFSDGSNGVADYAGELTGFLKPLASKKLFSQVAVKRGMLSWPGDFDVDATHTHALAHKLTPPKEYADVGRNILAVRLRDLRKRSGKSQGDVAKAMAVAQPTVAKIEAGEDPKVSTVRRYIEALGGKVELIAIVGGKRVPLEIPKPKRAPLARRPIARAPTAQGARHFIE